MVKFYEMLPRLVQEQGLKANPIDVRRGGFADIERGLKEMKGSMMLELSGSRAKHSRVHCRLERCLERSSSFN